MRGWNVLETDVGDGCSAVSVSLIPLSWTLGNGSDGTFYVAHVLPE